MKTIGIIIILTILMGIGACSPKPETTTTINNSTIISTSTTTTSESNSINSLFEILAAANAEVASVKIVNQAYATEHDGKYASSSGQLTQYLKSTPDATYYFNTDSGAITKAVNGSGITKTFHWDSAAQKWKE
jgi:hypothetical protein